MKLLKALLPLAFTATAALGGAATAPSTPTLPAGVPQLEVEFDKPVPPLTPPPRKTGVKTVKKKEASGLVSENGFVATPYGYFKTDDMYPKPLSDVFTLQSRPGASKTVYLDFNGATLGSNAASTHTTFGGAFTSKARTVKGWDLDGNPATFNDLERQVIYNVWLKVREDYRTLNVNVVTKPPTYDQLYRTSTADRTWGATALITQDTTFLSACGCAGQGYVGATDLMLSGPFYSPAVVLTRAGLNSASRIGETTSHEIGHNFGLSHDGAGAQPYSSGNQLWAPIMGAAYDKPITTFSKGEYAGATNREDDFGVMARHGVSTLPDDVPDSFAAAPLIAVNRVHNKLAETPADRDTYRFNWGGGNAHLVASAQLAHVSNVNMGITLYNSKGVWLGSNSQADGWSNYYSLKGRNGDFWKTLPKGIYYVRLWTTGGPAFTAYGVRGDYAFRVSTW